MRVTRKLAAEIRRGIGEKIGYLPKCEVGERVVLDTDEAFFNCARFHPDEDGTDLCTTWPLHQIGKDEIKEVDGRVELDVYCYQPDGDLDRNILAVIQDGVLVGLLSTRELIEREKNS